MEILDKLPSWYIMVLITAVIGAILYRLVRYGVTIKAGPVEIDADGVDKSEGTKVDK